jgi:hypothetical protein
MAFRMPSALRSAAFARPATQISTFTARRGFQTSQRMMDVVAAPVRKPVGAFRGT